MSRVDSLTQALPGERRDGSTSWRRLDPADRLGLGLGVALAGWTFLAALSTGGRPWGTVGLIAGVAIFLGVGRLIASRRPVLIPAAVAVIGSVAVVFLPREVFTASAVTPVLGYANAKAAFFVVAAAASLMVAIGVRPRVLRISALVAAAAFAIVPLASQAWAATWVAASLPLAAIAAARRLSVRLVSTLASVVVVATLAGTVVIAGLGPPRAVTDVVGARRVALWSEAFDLMATHPVAGVGPGRFATESPTARSDPDAAAAHHSFLQHGAETGIPGFVLLVSVFLWGFVRLTRARVTVGGVLAATALAGLGVLASFDSLLSFPALPLTVAALVGSAMSLPDRDRRWRPGAALRKVAKGAVLPLGLIGRRRPGDLVILLYHRVGAGDREIDVPLHLFRRQMERLADRERVLSLDQALVDGGGVVVSFDDGFADFHEHVVPVLADLQIPAVLYLATGLVGEGPEGLRWPQLQEAISTGLVTVGSHTHSHADLSRATASEAAEEMRRSRALIEDRLGVPCRHFAYPWAVASPAAEAAARSLFESAALDAWQTNRRSRIDPYRLGRAPVLRNDGVRFFGAKARGMLDGEGLAYRILGRGPWDRT
jgi:peptidoglycan/xylan/chitin deacetylase (PgdA/CDA1 family)